MKRLLFVSTGLAVGGAEIALLNLLRHLDRSRYEPHVVSLTGEGDIGRRIAGLGVPVLALDFRSRPLAAFRALVRHMRALRPAVVQTWMYHGDVIGSLAARLAGVRAIAWGLHNSTLSASGSRRSTRALRRVATWLSHSLPRTIVSCSQVARDVHVQLGYDASRFCVICNGFDLEQFRPDPSARDALRAEIGAPAGAPVVITVGRYDPQKNHPGFLRAAGRVHAQRADVRFVMVGRGLEAGNAELARVIDEAGVRPALHLLGLRADTARLMAGSDLLVLASGFGEAFPLVLGEAMACGVPCVATDVGDTRLIIGDTGRVVAPGDDAALAAALLDLLALAPGARAALGTRAREHIAAHYDIRSVARQYEAVYDKLIQDTPCAV